MKQLSRQQIVAATQEAGKRWGRCVLHTNTGHESPTAIRLQRLNLQGVEVVVAVAEDFEDLECLIEQINHDLFFNMEG